MDELKLIKKYYGEDFMHYARENFSTILEQEGALLNIMLTHFYPQKELYKDLDIYSLLTDFKNYIYLVFDAGIREIGEVSKTPEELLSEAGYNLYECKSEEDIQRFKKYYAPGEELCTFNGGRLKTDYVFFAVKKNVDEIKRKDFLKPERQDLYGTSVISIQFTRDEFHHLSIKNRYNHTVINPDATFSNNLDLIISGLTDSFAIFYQLEQKHKQKFEIPHYVIASDGRYYLYNYEINNIYYCPDNIIIKNGKVTQYPKERYLVMDYFVLDMKEKKVEAIDEEIEDSFIDTLGEIAKIEIKKEKESKILTITNIQQEVIIIKLNNQNEIESYQNAFVKKIGHDFLKYNVWLEVFEAENLEEVGDSFLPLNLGIKELYLNKLRKTGRYFLRNNEVLGIFDGESLEEVGEDFLFANGCLLTLHLNKLKKAGNGFLKWAKFLIDFEAENLEEMGNECLYGNIGIRRLTLNKLKIVGYSFLYENSIIELFHAEVLEEVGYRFLDSCSRDIDFYAPKLNKEEAEFILARIRKYS